MDFNLLVPALLLEGKTGGREGGFPGSGTGTEAFTGTEVASSSPSNDAASATRAVLNAVCHLAGRQTLEEPFYTFDGVRVME